MLQLRTFAFVWEAKGNAQEDTIGLMSFYICKSQVDQISISELGKCTIRVTVVLGIKAPSTEQQNHKIYTSET